MFEIKGAERRIRKIIVLVILVLTISSIFSGKPQRIVATEENQEITLLARGRRSDLDIFALIVPQLKKIGIDLEFCTCDCSNQLEHMFYGGQDMSIIRLGHNNKNPDFSCQYSSQSRFNYPMYNPNLDYNSTLGQGKNDWYLNYGRQILDAEERREHYWAWEQYYMDELLLYQPLFASENSYESFWDNLVGYNYSEGLVQSWGKMSWNGTHVNQANLKEISIADFYSNRFNTLRYSDWYSFAPFYRYNPIVNCCLDPLVWSDADGSFWPHLAKEIDYLNNTHLRITCREGIKWQDDPDGHFPNEFLDARDIYFTYSFLSQNSALKSHYNWLKDIKIVNDLTVDFFIDADPLTSRNEPFAWINNSLNTMIFPEHYLNQTQLEDGITPDGTHSSWEQFSNHCFGTGLFRIDSLDSNGVVLEIRDNNWFQDSTITSDPNLHWNERFGDFSSGLEILRIVNKNSDYSTVMLEEGYIDIGNSNALQDEVPLTNDNIATQSKPCQHMISLVYSLHPDREDISDTEYLGGEENITKGLALRKAISYAIDRDELNFMLFQNQYSINNYPIYPTLEEWCNPNITKYEYNLEKARYYMELLGFNFKDSSVNLGRSNFGIGFLMLIIVTFYCSKSRRKLPDKKNRRKYID